MNFDILGFKITDGKSTSKFLQSLGIMNIRLDRKRHLDENNRRYCLFCTKTRFDLLNLTIIAVGPHLYILDHVRSYDFLTI